MILVADIEPTPYAEYVRPWEGLNPPYRTIVADPPWAYDVRPTGLQGGPRKGVGFDGVAVPPPPYPMLSIEEIAALPIQELVGGNAHLYLWTTNRYLRDAYDVAEAWGFRYSQTLTWCKKPRGLGPGGAYVNTTEFVLFCRRGRLAHQSRVETTWWQWKRAGHSVKPQGFMDVVEQVSPGPYVELFARSPRLGWDAWGNGYEVAHFDAS